MQQKLVSYGDDYWIENALGQRVFFVDGKAFRLREHLGFKDMQGNELLAIQEKVMHIKDTYSIVSQRQCVCHDQENIDYACFTSVSMCMSLGPRIWKLKAISWIMNMRSTRDANSWPRFRKSGSMWPIHMVLILSKGPMTF